MQNYNYNNYNYGVNCGAKGESMRVVKITHTYQ